MKYKSEISAMLHETMQGLHEVGVIDKATRRECDKSCLTEVEPLSGEAMRAIREKKP